LKELKICLRKISIVDNTLEALGAPKEYQMLRNWIIRIIIGWIAIIYIVLGIHLLKMYIFSYNFELFTTASIIFIMFHYPESVIMLNVLICGTVFGYLSSRFHQINNRLHVLYFNLFENNTDYRYKRQNRSILACQWVTRAKDRKQYIWIIM
ncbi:hypothetical protein ALC62_06052, partial [Cyphomyrmex costatus]